MRAQKVVSHLFISNERSSLQLEKPKSSIPDVSQIVDMQLSHTSLATPSKASSIETSASRLVWPLTYQTSSAVAACILLIAAMLCAHLSTRYDSPLSDFIQDYQGALALRRGLSPYSEDVLHLMKEYCGVEGMKNFHPPFAATLFLPFTYINYPAAFVLYHLLLVVLHLYVVLRTTSIAGFKSRHRQLLVAASFLWFPFYLGLLYGNIALVIAAGILAAHDLALRNRDYSCGILLGTLGLLKLYPLIFLFSFIVGRRWRAVVAMLLAILFGVTLGGSFDHYLTFFNEVAPENVRLFGISPANMSLTGVLFPLFNENPWIVPFVEAPRAAIALQVAGTGAILLMLGVGIWKQRLLPEQRLSWLFAGTSLAMLLVSPTIWVHNFSVALLPLALLWRGSNTFERRLLIALILIALSLIGHNPLLDIALTSYAPAKTPAMLYLLLRVQPVAIVLLFILTVSTMTQGLKHRT